MREYCLRTGREDLLAEWMLEKNAPLIPDSVDFASNRRIWWRCRLGHEWRASIRTRVERGAGCPVCSWKRVAPGYNDLATLFPSLAAEWAKENKGVTPMDVTPLATRRIWWKCPCGHMWRSSVAARVKAQKECPYCRRTRSKTPKDITSDPG